MRAHELARKLLEGPDEPVCVVEEQRGNDVLFEVDDITLHMTPYQGRCVLITADGCEYGFGD